ncbi:polymorphic toxin-type HINT domain-containing protein [Streptomyces sp. NBC_01615]|uniref:polymorphic toxin-type HINT domain-containing protein n=1 Tax=Streptomyces sp. NBC_01615 TaxID=2975898 RepID=UPI00386B3C23
MATDPQTGVTAPEQVQNVIVTTTDKDFTELTMDTAPKRGPPSAHGAAHEAKLTTTWHHPFWDATHHRWTDAHNLTPGTKLRQADGTTVVILGVRNFHQHTTTYDLTVGTLHTYYVQAGDTPVLVHNCPRISERSGSSSAGDLPSDLLDPHGGGYNKPRRMGAADEEAGRTRMATEEMVDEASTRTSTVARAPGAAQKMIDGAQAPGSHGLAEVFVAGSIVTVRTVQNVRRWWNSGP